MPPEQLDDLPCGFGAHHFGTVRAGVHVTMIADLVAQLADVDLQDLDFVCNQRTGADPGHDSLESRHTGPVQPFQVAEPAFSRDIYQTLHIQSILSACIIPVP